MHTNICPCKNCEDREAGCHVTCAKYIGWKKIEDENKQKIINIKTKNREHYTFRKAQVEKAMRRH